MNKLKYPIVIQWFDEDNCFLVDIPDFPEQQWRIPGDTYETAGDLLPKSHVYEAA
ncbi:MAG: type II toxin-antitoxin system HicB family antitoxin [Microcoleus sp. SIO2G3]|nr:type II toxin-antitoxin system HicB family antitoxin [Microcoleus sp. SIO2G3]